MVAPAPEPTRIGSVVRRPLPDGRPYPAELAAHQLNAPHVCLVDDRIDLITRSYLRPGSVPYSGAERADLARLLRLTLFPEIYDPEYAPPPAAAPQPAEAPMPDAPEPAAAPIADPALAARAEAIRAEMDRLRQELAAVAELDRAVAQVRPITDRFPSLAALAWSRPAPRKATAPPAAAAPTPAPATNLGRVVAFLREVGRPASLGEIVAAAGVPRSSAKSLLYCAPTKARFKAVQVAGKKEKHWTLAK